ncbi:Dipeptide-binding protein [Serratia plymuthica]|uniref:Dipeptide-binding protein n=1 Tax=Serratia plymuthica TaxID=82996 RepID=A0A2X4U4N8_SERPL|nr:Dipeptide-binding protein [Serratia plymuthica]
MTSSLGKTGILKFGIGLIALTVAASVQAKTLVYCSEGSPEGFNPQLFTSGTTYDASSVPIYNRLVEFKIGTTELEPAWPKNGTSAKTAKPTLSTCVKA